MPSAELFDRRRYGVLFTAVLLLGLMLILMNPWQQSGRLLGAHPEAPGDSPPSPVLSDLYGLMLHPLILPALGLFWCLRRGMIDLSVWAVFAVSAAVAAHVAMSGFHPAVLLLAAMAVGIAFGGVNALLVRLTRAPAWMLTLLTATLAVGLQTLLVGRNSMHVPSGLLGRLTGSHQSLLTIGAFFLVAVLITGALSQRKGGPADLFCSGLFSALGGLCWLARSSEVPHLPYPVDDPRVAAAAVMAGAVVLLSDSRFLLTLVFLPPAMLLASLWRYMVWDIPSSHYAWGVVILTGMVLAAQWPLRRWMDRPVRPLLIASGIGLAGILVTAGAAYWPSGAVVLRWLGVGMSLACLGLTVADVLGTRKSLPAASSGGTV